MKGFLAVLIVVFSIVNLDSCNRTDRSSFQNKRLQTSNITIRSDAEIFARKVFAAGRHNTTVFYQSQNGHPKVLVHDDRISFGVIRVSKDGQWAFISMISHMNTSPPIQETDALVYIPGKEVLRPQDLGIGAGQLIMSFNGTTVEFDGNQRRGSAKPVSVTIRRIATLAALHPSALTPMNKSYLNSVWNIED